MKYLRTVSTRRLLAMTAGLIAAIAAGTAIAVAASGSGPVPPPKPLARALHDALNAPQVQGITARISFTNHLIDSSDIQGADPLLTGATGRLWLGADSLRLELQSDSGDAQVLVNKRSFWVYDPSSNTVYEGNVPAFNQGSPAPRGTSESGQIPSIADIQSFLNKLVQHANLSTAIPSDVAGRPAYTVRISPRHDGGLLGRAELAWDALRGVPLRIAVYARNESAPVLELKVTDISYGKVPASVFKISAPSGAKVVRFGTPTSLLNGHGSASDRGKDRGKRHVRRADVNGVAAVARHLHFTLVAPNKLVGLPRRSVSLLNWGGDPAALVSYGANLGGIAVIEQPAHGGAPASPSGGDHRGLSLPTVSINGATGQELDTALGTMVRFSRGGVTYTVLGSVPPAAAEAAARAL